MSGPPERGRRGRPGPGRTTATRGLLGVAILLVLAGCGGLPGAGTGGEGDARAVTPAAVPGDDGAPPGLTDGTVTDPAALATAHQRRLDATGYRLVKTRRVIDADGVHLNNISLSVVTTAGGDRYNLSRLERSVQSYRPSETYSRIDVWYANEAFRARLTDSEGAVRTWGNNDTRGVAPVRRLSERPLIEATLRAFRPTVIDVTETNDTTLYRLRADALAAPETVLAPPLIDDITNGSLTAVIDGAGRVRRLNVTYEATYLDAPVRVVQRVRVTDIGRSTPRQPRWVPDWFAAVTGG